MFCLWVYSGHFFYFLIFTDNGPTKSTVHETWSGSVRLKQKKTMAPWLPCTSSGVVGPKLAASRHKPVDDSSSQLGRWMDRIHVGELLFRHTMVTTLAAYHATGTLSNKTNLLCCCGMPGAAKKKEPRQADARKVSQLLR